MIRMDTTLIASAATTKDRPSSMITTDDDFMVVPQSIRQKFPADQLDEFLLETNFEGLTGAILGPPTIDHVNPYSNTILNGDPHLNAHSTNFPQPFLTGSSYYSSPPAKYAARDDRGHSFDIIGFDDCVQFDPPEVTTSTLDSTDGAIETDDQKFGAQHKQLLQFECSNSSWLSEVADLASMEKLAVENEQNCDLLQDLLFDVGDDHSYDIASSESDQVGAESMLEDIYRQAQEIGDNYEYTNSLDEEFEDDMTTESAPPAPRVAPKIPSKLTTPAPRFHLADHDFGFKKMRGKQHQQQPGSSSKKRRRNTMKREAVLKSKKRLQNREAAIRYRLKKRSEKMEKEGELGQILARNQYLKSEKRSLTAEVTYMKELLLEIRKMKGVQ